MRRVLLITILVAAILGLMATPALAASPHFKKGGTPVCTIAGGGTNSTSTTCTATLAGLSGANLVINVTVSGFAVYTCTNGGGKDAAGQNRVLTGPVTTPTNIGSAAIKNGNVTFTTNAAVLTAAPTVSGAAAGCPNPNWTGTKPQLTITSIQLQIGYGPATPQTFFYDETVANPSGLSSPVNFPA